MSTVYGRMSYQAIKSAVLEAYFDFCRDRGHGLRWSHENVLASIEYEYETAFQLPIEKLMVKVVELILSGGWYRDIESKIRSVICRDLQLYKLEEMLIDLPADEAVAFRDDLKRLHII